MAGHWADDWVNVPAPTEVLASHVVLSADLVAYVLGLYVVKGRRAGAPDPSQVRKLVDRGLLTPIDPTQPRSRWTFSVAQVQAYIAGAPARALHSLAVA